MAAGIAPAVQRDLQAGVAHPGAEVVAVEVGQLLAGHQPQPEEEWQVRVGAAGRHPLADLEVGVLEDVRRVDPAGQAAVEPEVDHPPQPLAIASEQRGQRRGVAGEAPAQQVIQGVGARGHDGVHT